MQEYIYTNDDEKILIPSDLKVGYNYRDEAYNNKLAFVTYIDNKGVIKYYTDWSGWIEKPDVEYSKWSNSETIKRKGFGTDDFLNHPVEGFVLDQTAGGTYQNRVDYVRVVDPRGFTVEIRTHNLLYILSETNSLKGKGLVGEFVYGWKGETLFLVPVSDNYLYNKGIAHTKTVYSEVKYKPSDVTVGDVVSMNDGKDYLMVSDYTHFYFHDDTELEAKLFYDIKDDKFYLFKIFGSGITNIKRSLYSKEDIDLINKNIPAELSNKFQYKYIFDEVTYDYVINLIYGKKEYNFPILIKSKNEYYIRKNSYNGKSFYLITTKEENLFKLKADNTIELNGNDNYNIDYRENYVVTQNSNHAGFKHFVAHKKEPLITKAELTNKYMKKFKK